MFHRDCLDHVPPGPHPERPVRLSAIERALQRCGLWERLAREEGEPVDPDLLTAVHTRAHVDAVRRAAERGGALLDPDTYVSAGSWKAALAAAGAAVRAAEAVASGQVSTAFAAVRPPGHHAQPARAMGFCLFNNVAVAARRVADRYDLRRVMIVDWDVHHGNGTQEIFYHDGGVLFVSLHQEDAYPGTGALYEVGARDGEGRNVNVPLPAGAGDRGYRTVFEEVVIPLGEAWRPDLVLVSAGYDAHHRDPLGSMRLTSSGFGDLARLLREGAARWCQGKLACVLEGGYDLDGLGASVVRTLEVLSGEAAEGVTEEAADGELPYSVIRERVRQVRRVLAHYWAI
ncbi:MAG: histone deacetylase [Armatimonadota bacterium]|nr:histone deacetylase [Armatimonadota bacterium]